MECQRAMASDWRASNPETLAETQGRYRQANRARLALAAREHRSNNREQVAARNRRYVIENRAYMRERQSNHRATRLQATPVWFSELDSFVIEQAAELAMMREQATGIPWDVDHMVPLRAREASGLHCAANFQVIPATMNRSKRNAMKLTTPGVWIAYL